MVLIENVSRHAGREKGDVAKRGAVSRACIRRGIERRPNMQTNCDFCAYNEYDEEDECYYCSVNMDEDDMARFIQSSYKNCPYFKSGDEYQVVRHQM